MSIVLPVELDWLLDLLGFDWPNLDEDKMSEAAEAWRTFGQACDQCKSDGTSTANNVRSSNSGEAIDAFGEAWGKFADDGLLAVGYLDALSGAAEVLAFLLDFCAMAILVIKIAIIAQLIELAIEFAIAQATAVVSLGTSEATFAARVVLARTIVRRILTEGAEKISAKVVEALEQKVVKRAGEIFDELLKATAKSVRKEAEKQLIKNVTGQQDGIDFTGLGVAAVNPTLKPIAGQIKPGENGGYDFKTGGAFKVAEGAYHESQGLGMMAGGDFSGGAKKVWEGHEEAVKGVRDTYEFGTKKRPEPDEEEPTAPSPSGGGGPAPTRPTPDPAPTPPTPPAPPTTPSGRDEANRARNTFG
ncbi:WXG100-like domain-containing protein [Streptomyces sp. NPDC054786]